MGSSNIFAGRQPSLCSEQKPGTNMFNSFDADTNIDLLLIVMDIFYMMVSEHTCSSLERLLSHFILMLCKYTNHVAIPLCIVEFRSVIQLILSDTIQKYRNAGCSLSLYKDMWFGELVRVSRSGLTKSSADGTQDEVSHVCGADRSPGCSGKFSISRQTYF